jgi:hypothetical protein
MKMFCYGCESVQTFTTDDPEEGPACECGHYQQSEAAGAAEVCMIATWHDVEAYKLTAAVARAGGFDVPESPAYFQAAAEAP